MTALDPIIHPTALENLKDELVLFDVRTGPNARTDYTQKGHLAGARFADLERDLAAVPDDAARGGRHPLPKLEAFKAFLGAQGVTRDSHVVAYDEQGGANAAARLWWMLRALGHARVQVLDGGLAAAAGAGLALTLEPPAFTPEGPYPCPVDAWPDVDIERVARARDSQQQTVLDVRAAARYRGEAEPIDPVAGHIPGAVNLPLSHNLGEDGLFKSADDLREQYEALLAGSPATSLIVHCGSGVTACHTLVALERAGLRGAKLYVGSWSEWCRQPQRPIATGPSDERPSAASPSDD